MLNKIVKKVFVFGALYMAWACVDQNSSELATTQVTPKISVVDGRVKFADTKTFGETLKALDAMDRQQQLKWAADLGHTTLQSAVNKYNATDTELTQEQETYMYYGMTHQLILNDKGMVQVGDDVILYKEQTKYYMTESEFNALSDPADITKSQRLGKYRITLMVPKSEVNGDPNARLWDAPTDGGYGTGGDMYEFTLSDGSFRKLTTVFIGHSDLQGFVDYCLNNENLPPYYEFANDLQLLLKLEGRANRRRSWSLANEPRSADWNLNITNILLWGPDECGSNNSVYYTTGGNWTNSM